MELTSEEGRVVGCLVEKQLTTPQLYPLTDNALIAACNQSTNRDPVVSYDVSTVRIAARSLREKGLLRMVHRSGERSYKHQHLLDSSLGLSPGQVTLLAVLLLRGPQTPAELRARSERMHPFETLAQVQEELAALAHRDDPLVARLERQPGLKETRYGQLLVDVQQAQQAEQAQQATASPLSDQRPPPGPPTPQWHPTPPGHPTPPDIETQPEGPTLVDLARQVELLRGEVSQLRKEVDRLRADTPSSHEH